MSRPLVPPGILRGVYPERLPTHEGKIERALSDVLGRAIRPLFARPGRFRPLVERVNRLGASLEGLSGDDLSARAAAARGELRSGGVREEPAALVFALAREFARRRLGLRPYDVQVLGGWVLLSGMVAEMETGEGKTLTATLPACAAALAGCPVHVITVNDYLALRDAEWMAPVYEAFGLKVGVVVSGLSPEERRDAYRCDVTYCTNKEVVFDYLKDRLKRGGSRPGPLQARAERLQRHDGEPDPALLRGLVYAIVDEADSVLIDEARTPLIISGRGDEGWEARLYQQALDLAGKLLLEEDFKLDPEGRGFELTEEGKERLEREGGLAGGFWAGRRRREEMARQALTALHLYQLDREYILKNGKVQIVDEYTGRVMADRSWERGLHQLIEAKEGCPITPVNETMARISYQKFFRRYHHLAGMTGTAREVAGELWSVYRLAVVKVPSNRPVVRVALPPLVHPRAEEKWAAVVERIAGMRKKGRPVLVGTRSVATSETLAGLLAERGIPHSVLNARQDREEAEIVARSGQAGQVTVATNMAGRGTDIALGPGVREAGGLFVILTEHHDAGRIDRQLFGRCGRQGDPGSYQIIASLEDEFLARNLKGALGRMARLLVSPRTAAGRLMGRFFPGWAQRRAQRRHFLVRRDLLKFDDSLDSAMAFSGRGE